MEIHFKKKGTYQITATCAISDAGLTAGGRGIITARRNGGSGNIAPINCVSGTGLLTLTYNLTISVDAGEYLEIFGWQNILASVLTQDAGLSNVSVSLVA